MTDIKFKKHIKFLYTKRWYLFYVGYFVDLFQIHGFNFFFFMSLDCYLLSSSLLSQLQKSEFSE